MITVILIASFTKALLNLSAKSRMAVHFGRVVQAIALLMLLAQYVIGFQLASYGALLANLILVTWLLTSSIPLVIKKGSTAKYVGEGICI
jgi:hypothetical protein